MLFETSGQAGAFLAMVYAGLLMGLGYDLLRALRRALRAGSLCTGLLDLCFWLGAALVAAATLAARGEGGLRLYALGGCACGIALYLAGISRVLWALWRAAAWLAAAIRARFRPRG
jgi:spore cortex biosynthesis protein YabQ